MFQHTCRCLFANKRLPPASCSHPQCHDYAGWRRPMPHPQCHTYLLCKNALPYIPAHYARLGKASATPTMPKKRIVAGGGPCHTHSYSLCPGGSCADPCHAHICMLLSIRDPVLTRMSRRSRAWFTPVLMLVCVMLTRHTR